MFKEMPIKKRSLYAAYVFCLTVSYSLQGADESLRSQIMQICNATSPTNSVAVGISEQQILGFLNANSTPEQKSVVYAAITKMYSRYPLPFEKKVMQYAQEALKNKPDLFTACEMYVCLGEASRKMCKNNQGQKGGEGIKKLAIPHIKGLSLVLNNLHTDTEIPLCGVDRFDVPNDHPRRAEFVARHERQMAARVEAEHQNELLSYRNIFCRYIFQYIDPSTLNFPEFAYVLNEALQDKEKEEIVLHVLKIAAEKETKRISRRVPLTH